MKAATLTIGRESFDLEGWEITADKTPHSLRYLTVPAWRFCEFEDSDASWLFDSGLAQYRKFPSSISGVVSFQIKEEQ